MLKYWCEITSCNGIKDLYESKNSKIGFVFWTAIMLTMTTATVWFTYRTIVGYINSPTVTNIDLVSQSILDLPELLLCYAGGLNVVSMRRENLSEQLVIDLSNALSANNGQFVQSATVIASIEELELYLSKNRLGIKQFTENFSFVCRDVLVHHSVTITKFGNPCSNITYLVTGKGKCYIIRSELKQFFPGLEGGIKIIVRQPKNSFYEVYPSKALEYEITSDFSLALEKCHWYQRTGRTFIVPMNVKMKVTLMPKRYMRSTSASKCLNDPTVFSSNNCYFNCYIKETLSACSCAPLDYWDESKCPPNTTICNPFIIGDCNTNKINLTNIQVCQKMCQPLCDEWVFENSVSYSSLGDNSSKSTSVVYIGYNTMQYTKIEEVESFSIDMAIANVGGQSGLWLGASIVTIIQAFYYLVIGIFQRICSSNHIAEGKRYITNQTGNPRKSSKHLRRCCCN